MNTKNNIITFALVGLAAGTVAWLLLGTKEGRKQLSCAEEGFRQFTEAVKNNAKKGVDQAARTASKATQEANSMREKAVSHGKSMLDKTNQAAKKAVQNVEGAVKAARRKTDLS